MACIEEPEEAWRLVVEISEVSADPWVLENLGAGPLETLLTLHGESTLKAVEAYASQRQEFLGVVAHVWPQALAPEVAKKLTAIMKEGDPPS